MLSNFTNSNKPKSPLTSNYWTCKTPHHMTLEIQVLTWDRHNNVAGYHVLNIYNILVFSVSLTITVYSYNSLTLNSTLIFYKVKRSSTAKIVDACHLKLLRFGT